MRVNRHYIATVYTNGNQRKHECDVVAKTPKDVARTALAQCGVRGAAIIPYIEGSASTYIVRVQLICGAHESERWYQC